MFKRKFEGEGDVKIGVEQLFKSSGIEIADRLSIYHINQSLVNLRNISQVTEAGI